KLALDGLLTQ
ncbi:hypothetical protein A2U01_0109524, partial [Trifolium medium]|nr:hypothetical protein [Trifolium medium]